MHLRLRLRRSCRGLAGYTVQNLAPDCRRNPDQPFAPGGRVSTGRSK